MAMGGATPRTPTRCGWWYRGFQECEEVLPQFTLRLIKIHLRGVGSGAAVLEAGRTYPLLYNDDVLVPGMMKAFRG